MNESQDTVKSSDNEDTRVSSGKRLKSGVLFIAGYFLAELLVVASTFFAAKAHGFTDEEYFSLWDDGVLAVAIAVIVIVGALGVASWFIPALRKLRLLFLWMYLGCSVASFVVIAWQGIYYESAF